MLKKLITALAVVGASVSAANAATSGNVDLQVKLPEVLVLYHWDKAGIELNPVEIAEATGIGTGKYDFKSTNIEVLDNNNGVDMAELTDQPMAIAGLKDGRPDANIIAVTLKDSWAVRSLTQNGVKLAIENTGTDSTDHVNGNSKVVTKDAKVQSANVTAGDSIDLASKWEPTKGDITFNLDLSGATKSGLHKSAGETFTLTLTSK